ncbi:MAG: aldo/keto reductase, partial [Promethearchaeota archaeon]
EFLEKQLKRLQTDYLDVYLVHSMNKEHFKIVKENKVLEKLEEARAKGIIKYIGFSFHDEYDVFKEIIDYYDWDIAQIQYNYLDIDYQATTKGLKYAAEKGIAMVIMEPLQGGKLTREFPDVMEILDNYKYDKTLADIAFKFLWDKKEISVVLSGMSEKWMVEENIESAERSSVDSLKANEKEMIAELRKAFKQHNIIACTSCEYCMPCPNSVHIPRIMSFLNDFAWWGEKERERYIRYYNRFLMDEDELKESENKNNGKASLCTECQECLEKCPQGINIPEMMEKARLVFEEGKNVSEIMKSSV